MCYISRGDSGTMSHVVTRTLMMTLNSVRQFIHRSFVKDSPEWAAYMTMQGFDLCLARGVWEGRRGNFGPRFDRLFLVTSVLGSTRAFSEHFHK